MSFEDRIEEKKIKFLKKHDIQYEDLDAFVEWIIWYTKQNTIKTIKENIK